MIRYVVSWAVPERTCHADRADRAAMDPGAAAGLRRDRGGHRQSRPRPDGSWPRRAAVHRRRVHLPGAAAVAVPVAGRADGSPIAEAAHVLAAYEALADAEIIHDHTILGPLLAGRRGISRPPVVTTIHGRVTPRTAACWPRPPGTRRSWRSRTRMPAASAASRWRRSSITASTWTSTRPGPGTGGYLLFVGRMSADKGVHHAVRVARRAGWPLVITAKMQGARRARLLRPAGPAAARAR